MTSDKKLLLFPFLLFCDEEKLQNYPKSEHQMVSDQVSRLISVSETNQIESFDIFLFHAIKII
jgi:hypothetical protein